MTYKGHLCEDALCRSSQVDMSSKFLNNFRKVIFDVRPSSLTGSSGFGGEINLRKQREEGIPDSFDNLMSEIFVADPKEDIGHELTSVINQEEDLKAEFARIGVVVLEGKKNAKPRRRPVLQKFKIQNSKFKINEEDFYERVMDKIREPVVARKAAMISSYKSIDKIEKEFHQKRESMVETDVASFYQRPEFNQENSKPKPFNIVQGRLLNFSSPAKRKKKFFKFWILGVLGIGVVMYGFTLKRELLKDGTLGLDNLQQAQESLKSFNFKEAAESFQKSYEDFAQAGRSLDLMGAGLVGTGKLKSAKGLVEVGKLVADAGQAMSSALSSLSKTGAILNPADSDKTKPSKIIGQIKEAVLLSDKNFSKAKTLLASIDEGIIPEDKREIFTDFKSEIPIFEKSIVDAVGYIDFLEAFIGIDRPKKYLFLFQNNSELRPTGGFPGTYGVISFANGGLDNFFVDDIYNLDGQLKKNIVPPKQLQHITPTWGMRDAVWFLDFPTSAKKVASFFYEEAGYRVDGVIALNPDVVSRILEVVGPIKLPEYEMTLDQNNFLASIQEEVEYGENRVQPKKVIVDFAPRFLEKLYSADSEQWMKIFAIFANSLEEKDMILYLEDKSLEKFVVEKGFGGEVKKVDSDYLMVTFSNIKGSKTDAVTDSSISIESRFEVGRVVHRVSITRMHNGGSSAYGFYNRQNPAYARVLLPNNAELIEISGNDLPNFKPLISYDKSFTEDSDLNFVESNSYFDKKLGVNKYEESGKKGLGFWLVTDPGKTKKVELEYSVPFFGDDYAFYFQKQPGLDWKNFKFMIKQSNDRQILNASSVLSKIGDTYMTEEILKKDFVAGIQLK